MTDTAEGPAGTPGRDWRDATASILMVLASVGALISFAGAVSATRDAGSDTAVVEAWRMLGFLVFAGIFLLLAVRPRAYPGIWELAFLHKAGMAGVGAVLLADDATDAGTVLVVDGALAVVILVAYVLARGYTAWRRLSEPPPRMGR